MAKRGYKLQEFVAHASSVSCLNVGKKSCRLLVTGGEDHKVNLWAVGKTTSLMSLPGHTSPVESVTFDSAEVLVVAGASTGVIKLWDLEEAKIVRTLTGHRSNCTAVEFHPFGEFFASGSLDTNLKIWDIRKKGCIHTYEGHTRGVSTIRFTPDGRWVVSGGFDNAVKVWDLTAGKLLHDFKFHEGQIRCIEFHPLEFLLATGSADRTVKFWDLETFELIGSAGPEATGVRSMTFHPDGITMFCGLDDSLKVFSWEPIICHDAVDMGWSTLGDLCIHEGKLLGCSYHQNCVGVWVADISHIGPNGVGTIPRSNVCPDQKFNPWESHSEEKVSSGIKSTLDLLPMPPDYETKEIKNIYVDTWQYSESRFPVSAVDMPLIQLNSNTQWVPQLLNGDLVCQRLLVRMILYDKLFGVETNSLGTDGNHVTPQRVGSVKAPKVVLPLDYNKTSLTPTMKKSPATVVHKRTKSRTITSPLSVPIIVPRNSQNGGSTANSRRESITTERTSPGVLLKPTHVRRPSNNKCDLGRLSKAVESGSFISKISDLETVMEPDFHPRLVAEDEARESCVEKHSNIKNVAEKFEKILSPQPPPNHENCEESLNYSKGISSGKFGKGGFPIECQFCSYSIICCMELVDFGFHIFHVVPGRTRSLVERWERREKFNDDVALTTSVSSGVIPETDTLPPMLKGQPQTSGRELTSANNEDVTEALMQNHDIFLSTLRSRLTKLQYYPFFKVAEDFSSNIGLQEVWHFWERNDIKGAISAMRKVPDYSVQSDVISVLMEKMEIVTLDLFSCLLPLLMGLLHSKIDRNTSVSLEMLLKLVTVFGPVIHSTISASPAIGVDLQAEQRRECCCQCFIQLQKIKQVLPSLIRRGGLLAKCAQELNLVLQEP
ncbi:hypothetical protein HHK36_005408 [Tetracentron sinense]|uniref:Katanin p80 WD40 repeat-containing subunit B1 homolog n=1 Tax=Tetracentron sinense TaxID=13715 RepID=A0A835DMB0_TETSI|nr:hypothetical protein HHK36_005408 [Tetracentron sinense]